MSASVKNRAAVIREYVNRLGPVVDPAVLYRYSVVAARWEALRLLIDRGGATPADDRRFRDLSGVLRTLTEKVGLSTVDRPGADQDAVAGITARGGFLPLDASYLLNGETWQSAAEGW